KRMEYVEQVREYKEATSTPVKNKSREADIINSKLNGVTEFASETKEFFKTMIEISCKYQDERLSKTKYNQSFNEIDEDDFFANIKTVCHQGIVGSYSYEVAQRYFADKEIISVSSFKDVFDNVAHGIYDIGILPLENLCQGSVSDVFDLLNKYDVSITHNVDFPVRHCLAGHGRLDDVTTVISHPQALGQCSEYIETKGFLKAEAINTAVAAFEVSNDDDTTMAAICSPLAAEKFNLTVFDEDIANIKNNKTKFIFITKKHIMVKDSDKVSIVFTIPHESGTLSRVLNDFANNDINMSKIESRPSNDGEWKYVFYIDLDIPEFDVIEYFSKKRYMFEDFKILGIHKTME
ncbi:MAG: prephenate dehydratase domain-containing protein, partial [Clostridia bacterium]|nr:prephenate dehydratase domain-containing protein [Clostridia bacterium]